MRIDEILVRRGLLTQEQMLRVRTNLASDRFDHAVVAQGLVDEEQMLRAFADELGTEFVDVRHCEVDRELLGEFPTSAVFRHKLLPLRRQNGQVIVATSDPFDLQALNELSALSGHALRPVLARREDLFQSIKQHLGVSGDTIDQLVAQKSGAAVELADALSPPTGELSEIAQTPSVVRLVNELLQEAIEQNASDVHIEPEQDGLVVRFRVDGILQIQPVPPEINQFYAAIITRLKIMAQLNIAERRLPQDGRIKLRMAGREIDVRVSVIPMLYGEGMVMRLLDRQQMIFDLSRVGMPAEMQLIFRQLIKLPHGIILVTGPTGSGKTTTLYSALHTIKSSTLKIVTIEDPVEYQAQGISQIQVASKIGLSFAAGLRSILRHDPDVILIGEIRDSETASSAIQAALTGHLVFSTLHTNDATAAFTRLIDMGIEPYLVASTVDGVLAQRLVRVLCKHCKESYLPDPEDLPADFPATFDRLWRPTGCRQCRNTGYAGRTGVYELWRSDAETRRLCIAQASSEQIREHAIRGGLVTLRQSGWQYVLAGVTSLDEVLRIAKD
jgi:general secretion pathway protein E/type IV pilus assembly protein PilB